MGVSVALGCMLALTGSITLIEGRGSFDYSRVTPILTLDDLAPRVAGQELAIETDRGHTKVTSSDLADTSATARDEETLVDEDQSAVAARLCQPTGLRKLDLGRGEIILCTAGIPAKN